MFEVVIPGMRYGEGKINSSTAYRGSHCYLAGVNAAGYQLLQLAYDTNYAAISVYPVNKYYFAEDYSDTASAVDLLTKGDTVVYYGPGEYITDRFEHTSFGFTPTYWAEVEKVSTVGAWQTYAPGSSTAHGTTGLKKVYVSSGLGRGLGRLMGDTACAPTLASTSPIGFVVGFYYTDSSDVKIRYRLEPTRSPLSGVAWSVGHD